MLSALSGTVHQVLTGWCVVCRHRGIDHAGVVATAVHFKELTHAEIDWYVGTREPFDKAGAYAIQGIGTAFVRRIDGSYSNVVGLPVCEVIERMVAEGVIVFP